MGYKRCPWRELLAIKQAAENVLNLVFAAHDVQVEKVTQKVLSCWLRLFVYITSAASFKALMHKKHIYLYCKTNLTVYCCSIGI